MAFLVSGTTVVNNSGVVPSFSYVSSPPSTLTQAVNISGPSTVHIDHGGSFYSFRVSISGSTVTIY